MLFSYPPIKLTAKGFFICCLLYRFPRLLRRKCQLNANNLFSSRNVVLHFNNIKLSEGGVVERFKLCKGGSIPTKRTHWCLFKKISQPSGIGRKPHNLRSPIGAKLFHNLIHHLLQQRRIKRPPSSEVFPEYLTI